MEREVGCLGWGGIAGSSLIMILHLRGDDFFAYGADVYR